jgi:hypothetical protein
MAKNDKLVNSFVTDDESPLAVEHARILQAVTSARTVLKEGLDNYKTRKTTYDQLWSLFEAARTTRKMLDTILGDDDE